MITTDEFTKRLGIIYTDQHERREQRLANERELRALCALHNMTVELSPGGWFAIKDQHGMQYHLSPDEVAQLVAG